MTIREFVHTVWAGKYYVLAAVLVVVAGALFYLDRQDTLYRASATVQLYGVQSAQGGEELVEVTVATDPDDVTSPEVAEAAATALGEPTSSAPELAALVTAEVDGETRVVDIAATTPDEAWSVEVANAFAEAYAAQLVTIQAAQVEEFQARREALAEQLKDVRLRLGLDEGDPLALAEQDIIVNDYSALTIQSNSLRGIAVPGEVVSPASGAEALGLSRATVLALAVLVGLVAGIGLAFARRGLDVRVRSAAESTRLTETPVLAELFATRPAEKEFGSTHALPVASKVATPFTESIRELRTAIQVSTAGMKHAVVVVTAADPSAPRSFITANLAASFALSGRRTIALSGDLRRPQLDRMLPPPESWQGDEQTLRPTTVPNLRVMPVPEEEMDPADFLATARARQLVESLREHAEVVVIDSPPVLAAADATILGGYSNGVVLIAAAGRTDRAVLVEATDRLRASNVPLLGIAITGVKGDRRMLYASTYGDPTAEAVEDHGSVGPGAHSGAGGPVASDEDVSRAVNGDQGAEERAAPDPSSIAEQGSEHRPVEPADPAESATRRASVVAASVPVEHATRAGRAEPSMSGAARGPAAGRRTVLAPTWSKVEPAMPEETEEGETQKVVRKRPFRW
ncbi:polysaccharide biosynthesis tyrosine autokinase [Cellulosimicrobium sp. Marseille-Q4280]|uniref:polysaccharide biosynthesis tyrosine autokinase n=1 Tax=Cellulosimicrobium sp. Marseille-Q4280 TaxID=2937992 RepID=UPI00203A42F6|nr:polysaccharide biosynthesis tyrosine autokinase [Cellulosimicrobium sp. Marseille-Q4280]